MEADPEVDAYIDGSDKWPAEMTELRSVLLNCGLDESIKWRTPCFSHHGRNVVLFQEMKECLALMFFKGALLADDDGLLVAQGPNSRSARRLQITSVEQARSLRDPVRELVENAIEVEASGLEVEPAPDLELVEELRARLDSEPQLAAAFATLTPGRQREYNLYFSSAKQAKTRTARVEKYAAKILEGKGFRDR